MKDKGVVLLSGGIDSAVTAWITKQECEELHAITLRYGQRHDKEISCALQLGQIIEVEWHRVLDLPLDRIGGSALVGNGDIPTEEVEGIPSTWVPQRNSIFLAIAFGWAEVIGASRVYIGVNSVDYSGYPDCRPEFITQINLALNLASKQFVERTGGITIMAPIINFSKKEIVELGLKLGVPFERTWSCYEGVELACGICPSCRIRLKAFADLGKTDLIKYNLNNICDECLKGSDMPDCPLPVVEQEECVRLKGINFRR